MCADGKIDGDGVIGVTSARLTCFRCFKNSKILYNYTNSNSKLFTFYLNSKRIKLC